MPMMKCGHASNATKDSKPVCIICYGIRPGADEIDDDPPDLTGRMAKCVYCQRERISNVNLAFFEHKPKQDKDSFYCGCRGWD